MSLLLEARQDRPWLPVALALLVACGASAHRGSAENAAPSPSQAEEASVRRTPFERLVASGSLPPFVRPPRRLRFGRRTDQLLRKIYGELGRRTFYCSCPFDAAKWIDPEPCGFLPAERWKTRASRVEWEHVLPASRMFAGRPCTTDPKRKKGARAHCRRTDPEFRAMEADLHNLVPSIGQLNAERANFPYGEVPGESRRFGECDFEVEDGVAEPAPAIRGDIARIYFYMEAVYGVELSDGKREMLVDWASGDPPTRSEVTLWNRKARELGVSERWKPLRGSTGRPPRGVPIQSR